MLPLPPWMQAVSPAPLLDAGEAPPPPISFGGQPPPRLNSVPFADAPITPIRPAAPPTQAPAVPPTLEPYPGDPSMSRSMGEQGTDEYNVEKSQLPMPFMGQMGPVGVPAFGRSTMSVGGPAQIAATFDKGAEEIAAGHKAQAAIAGLRGGVEQQVVNRNEMQSAIQRGMMQRDQGVYNENVKAKVAEINKATEAYTNDLADTGKYWANPGNVIAGIGAALIALGSPRDPGVGIRIIQESINADFQRRRAAADTKLGAMRSNLAQYRQLWGDKQLGDQWAYAETQRVAADQMLAIAAQFKGPEAMAKAQTISAQLKQAANQGKLEVLKATTIDPRLMPKWMWDAYQKAEMANPGAGFQDFTKAAGDVRSQVAAGMDQQTVPGVQANRGNVVADQTRFFGSAEPEKGYNRMAGKGIAGIGNEMLPPPSTGATTKTAVTPAVKAFMNHGGPVAKKVGGLFEEIYGPENKERMAALDAKFPGLANTIREQNELKVQVAMNKPRATKQSIISDVTSMVLAEKQEANKAAAAAFQKTGDPLMWAAMKSDMNRMKAVARSLGRDPSDVRGFMTETWPALASELNKYRTGSMADRSTSAARQRLEELEAAERFHQMIADASIKYYAKNSGSAISEGEENRLKQVISSGSNLSQIENFVNMNLDSSGRELRGLLNQVDAGPRTHLMVRYGSVYNVHPDIAGIDFGKK